jgi:hypothetical protein
MKRVQMLSEQRESKIVFSYRVVLVIKGAESFTKRYPLKRVFRLEFD